MAKKIFIAATMQNDGKTTVSLGLTAAFKKYFDKISFIKPIGQRYLIEQGYKVDEDSVLIEAVFGIKCDVCNIKDMSPIAIEKGFTERYIENGPEEDYAARIKSAFEHVASGSDLVIIEGTGHAGVGSVFDLSNATVARLLDANVILVSSGGVGRPIDEIMLNKALFDREGVNIAGVIINKVLPEKFEKISSLVKMGLAKKGLSLLGVLPYQKILDTPTMREIKEEVGIGFLYEGEGLDGLAEQILIGAMRVGDALNFIKNNTLMIIPGDRDDMIKAVCDLHMGKLRIERKISGIILSGGLMPKDWTLNFLKQSNIPTLMTKEDTYSVASRIHHILIKLHPQDTSKIKTVVDMVEKHVDIGEVLASLR